MSYPRQTRNSQVASSFVDNHSTQQTKKNRKDLSNTIVLNGSSHLLVSTHL